mgnify:CR=1 FL=1
MESPLFVLVFLCKNLYHEKIMFNFNCIVIKMKKEYIKPIAEVTTCCDSENILSASRPEKPVIIEVDEKEEEGIFGDDWEVD